MKTKTKWRIGFLGVTVLAIAMELYASFDGNPETEPWTWLIIGYIPSWVTFSAITGLFIWLIVHFARRYKKK